MSTGGPQSHVVEPRIGLLCVALLLTGSLAPGVAEEEILLNLPREFDVTARRPAWEEVPADIEQPPALVFRFRGERFRATTRWAYHSGTHVREESCEGTFRRGRLEGTCETFVQVSYAETPSVAAGCEPHPGGAHFKEWQSGRIEGTATPDGLLSLSLRITSHRALTRKRERDYSTSGCYRDLGWVDTTRESETEWAQKWTPYTETIVLRLPVGELQSSQALSTPPPPAAPRVSEGTGESPAGDVASAPGSAAAGVGPVGGTEGVAVGAPGGAAESASPSSPWSVPVSPGAAAGAAAAVALTSLLGALWMFGASGLSPGDLLGSAPAVDELDPAVAPAPPIEPPVVSHRDGEVNPDTGEVWSESVGGWVGANYHEIERRHQAEVRRAQAVSDRESRQESARIAEELRASRARQATSARREAEAAAHAEQWTESATIEPYRPGWTDYATTALEWAEWGTDTSVSVLGSLTGPAGARGAEIYTVVKETVKGVSEGVADYSRGTGGHAAEEGSVWVIVERGLIGGSKGVAKVGLDRGVGKLMDGFLDRVVSPGASTLTEMATTPVREVTKQLVSATGREARRSTGVALGRALVGSEIQAPVKDAVKGVTGESL